jgi:hypothetical protein
MATWPVYADTFFNGGRSVSRSLKERCHVGLEAISAGLFGRIGEIATLTPDSVKGYQTLSNAGKKTNHLDAKTRELIAVAVAVSLSDATVVSQSIPLKR